MLGPLHEVVAAERRTQLRADADHQRLLREAAAHRRAPEGVRAAAQRWRHALGFRLVEAGLRLLVDAQPPPPADQPRDLALRR